MSGLMSIIFLSLSFTSFTSKRCTGSISVIDATPRLHQLWEWCSEKRKSNKQRVQQSENIRRILWNYKNCNPIAKHLAWEDYTLASNICITYRRYLRQSYSARSRISSPTLGKITKTIPSNWNSINMGRVWLVLNRLFSPVATVLRIFRCSCPSFLMTITRMMTSNPSRVHAARRRGFYLKY